MEEFEQKDLPQEKPEQADNSGLRRQPEENSLYEWVRSSVSAVLLIALLFTFLVRMMGVQGPSMIPTLQQGDRLLVVNSLLVRDYRQGDVVIAQKDSFSDDPIVKRVIAVGGQTVDIDFNTGAVYVDGTELEEDYINDLTYTYEGLDFPVKVEEGSVFLRGDNRNHSTDSREPRIGTVDQRCLIGKAVFILFPGPDSITKERDFGRIGFLKAD